MPYHDWSDDTFDWNSLHEAINYITDYCIKYGRIGIHSKEKWGCARFSTYWFRDLHTLIYPRYTYIQFPKWLHILDMYVFERTFYYSGITFLMIKWQLFIFEKAFKNALKKWPHIKDEITADLEPSFREKLYHETKMP